MVVQRIQERKPEHLLQNDSSELEFWIGAWRRSSAHDRPTDRGHDAAFFLCIPPILDKQQGYLGDDNPRTTLEEDHIIPERSLLPPGVSGRRKNKRKDQMAKIADYRVGVVLSVVESDKKGGGKALRVCSINVGDVNQPLTVVTTASNVREGSRVAVAPVGSIVIKEDGEELKIEKTTIGGTISEGMLCDSRMLGWPGGASGIAVQIPDSIDIGNPPPATKPRPDGEGGGDPPVSLGPVTDGLFAPKLSKEEKKKLAAEKRAAKKASKETK